MYKCIEFFSMNKTKIYKTEKYIVILPKISHLKILVKKKNPTEKAAIKTIVFIYPRFISTHTIHGKLIISHAKNPHCVIPSVQFSSVQSLSRVRLFAAP